MQHTRCNTERSTRIEEFTGAYWIQHTLSNGNVLFGSVLDSDGFRQWAATHNKVIL
jgi:hypothetical protein